MVMTHKKPPGEVRRANVRGQVLESTLAQLRAYQSEKHILHPAQPRPKLDEAVALILDEWAGSRSKE